MSKFLLLVIALLSSLNALAGGIREISLGPAGTLQYDVADDWREVSAPSNMPNTVMFESKTANRLQILLTAGTRETTDAEVRTLVQRRAERLGPQSTERTPSLETLRGAQAAGYYFKATDPAPKVGEFRFLDTGAVSLGPALAVFTIVYNEGADKDAQAALSSIRGLRLKPGR